MKTSVYRETIITIFSIYLGGKGGGGDDVVLGAPRLDVSLRVVVSSRQVKLAGNTLNSVGRVDVLDQHNLEAGSRALSRCDGGVGQKVLPNL